MEGESVAFDSLKIVCVFEIKVIDIRIITLVCRKTIPGRDVKGTGASQELGKHGSIVFPGETTGGNLSKHSCFLHLQSFALRNCYALATQ